MRPDRPTRAARRTTPGLLACLLLLSSIAAGCGGDGSQTSSPDSASSSSGAVRTRPHPPSARHLLAVGATFPELGKALKRDLAGVDTFTADFTATLPSGAVVKEHTILDDAGNCSGSLIRDGATFDFVVHGDRHLITSSDPAVASVFDGRWLIDTVAHDFDFCTDGVSELVGKGSLQGQDAEQLLRGASRIGKETLAGHPSLHVRTSERGTTLDLWLGAVGRRLLPLQIGIRNGTVGHVVTRLSAFDKVRVARLPPRDQWASADDLGLDLGLNA